MRIAFVFLWICHALCHTPSGSTGFGRVRLGDGLVERHERTKAKLVSCARQAAVASNHHR